MFVSWKKQRKPYRSLYKHVQCRDDCSCSQIIKLRPVVKNSPLRVGVEKKLRVELRKLNEGVIVKSICEQCVQWSFNLYDASHFGGLWKR